MGSVLAAFRDRLPGRAAVVLAAKVISGSLLVLALVLIGGQHSCNLLSGCMTNTFLLMTPLTLSLTGLAMGLLLSAFRDVLLALPPMSLLERDIESVAGPAGENLDRLYLSLTNYMPVYYFDATIWGVVPASASSQLNI